MPIQYEARLKNEAGSLAGIFTDWEQLGFSRRVNDVGTHVLQIGGGDNELAERDVQDIAALFDLDGQVEIWRRDPVAGIPWYKECESFHRNHTIWRDEAGWHYLSTGYSYEHLLWRTIIEAAAGTAGSDKTGKAETVMKAYVNEQAGPGAGARARTGLSIQADGGNGNDWPGPGMGQNLLLLCQNIAKTGGGDFAIVGTGAATFEFRWYTGQLGTDRRSSILFALNYGNMRNPMWEVQSNGPNAVLVAGQGKGSDRERVWVTDAASIAESTWNRLEKFKDGRDMKIEAGLILRGEEEIEANKRRKRLTFEVQQTTGRLYGRDYYLGDLVRAQFLDFVVDRKITGISGVISRPNPEQLQMELTDV